MSTGPYLRKCGTSPDSKNEKQGQQSKGAINGPQPNNLVDKFVCDHLGFLSPRLKTFVVRTVLTIVLLVLLPMLLFGGYSFIFLIITYISLQCYSEFIRVGYNHYAADQLPMTKTFAWYVYLLSAYLFMGEFFINYLSPILDTELHLFLLAHHSLICFVGSVVGVIFFVCTLKKKFYKQQFTLFGFFLVGSILFCVCTYSIFLNFTHGMLWGLLPMSLMVTNDIFSYIIGGFFGKTPLIKLSPKKTWEGFLGSAIITLVFSVVLGMFMIRYPYFYCHQKPLVGAFSYNISCKNPHYLIPKLYDSNTILRILFLNQIGSLRIMPVYVHFLAIGMFVSMIAPFGGFLASGFKRAFKIKDFGDTFPGHGGMLDRMDCQLLLTLFVRVYIISFISSGNVHRIFGKVLKLSTEDQLRLFGMLRTNLQLQGFIGAPM